MIYVQENEKSPTVNKKTKDASSDNIKGEYVLRLSKFCCFLVILLYLHMNQISLLSSL